MTTAFRAALAFALLAGFYVLVGLVLAVTAFFDIWVLVDFRLAAAKIAIVLTLAAGALLRALWMVTRRSKEDPPGVPVTPEQEPELWRTVGELAQRVQTAPPHEIRLVAEVNAAVSEDTRFLGLRATKRRMYIGLPLMQTLTVDEMRAVLGHELGHYSGAHTRLGAPVYRGRVALVAAVQGLGNHPWVQKIFYGYTKLYLRVSQAVSRKQELEADEFAVAIAGRAAMAGALRRIHGTAAAWDVYMDSYVAMTGIGGNRPAALFGGFRALVGDPARQAELGKKAEEPEETSPYDSHPSLHERLAAIALLPEPAHTPDPRSAMALLRDPAVAVEAVERSMWTPQALTELTPVSWEELVEQGMFAVRNAEALQDLAKAGQVVMGTAEPYLDAAFEAIARGRQAQLAERLQQLGWNRSATLVGGVLEQALEGLLVKQGHARWTLSWSGPAKLLFVNGGAEVDLTDYANQTAAHPDSVPKLREWVASLGVRADYVPSTVVSQP